MVAHVANLRIIPVPLSPIPTLRYHFIRQWTERAEADIWAIAELAQFRPPAPPQSAISRRSSMEVSPESGRVLDPQSSNAPAVRHNLKLTHYYRLQLQTATSKFTVAFLLIFCFIF